MKAFFAGALFSTIVFLVAGAFWLFLFTAAAQAVETRRAMAAMIGISKADKRCLEWLQREDDAWICIKR